MGDETSFDVEVTSVGVSEKVYFDSEENEVLKIVHRTLAKGEGMKVTFQGSEPFPWRIGDPLTVRVATTQAHLDEFEEGKK